MARSCVLAFLLVTPLWGQAPVRTDSTGHWIGQVPPDYAPSTRNPLAQGPPGYQAPWQEPSVQVPPTFQSSPQQLSVPLPPSFQPPAQEPFVQMPEQPVPPPENQQSVRVPGQPQPDDQQPEESVPINRAGILKQRDLYLSQSQANINGEIQRATANAIEDRAAFLDDVEQAKIMYLEELERGEQQRLQDLDAQHIAKVKLLETAGQEYAERIEQQAKGLVAKSLRQELQRAHADKVQPIDQEEFLAKDELEHQIRAAYDAVKLPSGVFADPNPTIQAARTRFEGQIQELAAKRAVIDEEFARRAQELEVGDAGWV